MQVSYFPNDLPIWCLYVNHNPRRLKGENTTFKNRELSHVPNENNDVVSIISICNSEGLAMLIKAFCNINKYRDYSQQMSPEY